MLLTAVILTKNEEKHIVDCVQSVDFCDEIVIIDDFSEDRTRDLIKNLKNPRVKIIQHELQDFSKQRNFAFGHVSGKWTLFIDADERVSEELKVEIIRAVGQEKHIAYRVKRHDLLWGKVISYGEVGGLRLLRLARTDIGLQKWKGMVHETWDVHGLVGELINPLLHYPHQTIREFLADIDRYSSMRAEELHTLGKESGFFQIAFYPVAKFVQNYIFKKGYKDGVAGCILAGMMSFHSFLVRGKLFLWKEETKQSLPR